MEATLTKKDGKIQMDKSFEFMCSTLRNGEYTVTIKKKTQPRTLNQNALMWKWFQCIGACLREYTGEEYWSTAAGVQDIHDLYCKKFLVKQVHVNGKVETIVRGTSKLNTLEMHNFMESVKIDAERAKKIKSDAQDRLASIKTEIKDLAAEVKKGTREYHLSSKNTIRFALDGYFLYYSWVNGEFKLVKAEKIPDWDKRSLWAQEDRNRKAMLDLFGIEYPEVERPIDDTEDYGDKFEEDLSDKLPEEEPEDDE